MNSQGKTFTDGAKPKSARAPCQSRKCTRGNKGWFLRKKIQREEMDAAEVGVNIHPPWGNTRDK